MFFSLLNVVLFSAIFTEVSGVSHGIAKIKTWESARTHCERRNQKLVSPGGYSGDFINSLTDGQPYWTGVYISYDKWVVEKGCYWKPKGIDKYRDTDSIQKCFKHCKPDTFVATNKRQGKNCFCLKDDIANLEKTRCSGRKKIIVYQKVSGLVISDINGDERERHQCFRQQCTNSSNIQETCDKRTFTNQCGIIGKIEGPDTSGNESFDNVTDKIGGSDTQKNGSFDNVTDKIEESDLTRNVSFDNFTDKIERSDLPGNGTFENVTDKTEGSDATGNDSFDKTPECLGEIQTNYSKIQFTCEDKTENTAWLPGFKKSDNEYTEEDNTKPKRVNPLYCLQIKRMGDEIMEKYQDCNSEAKYLCEEEESTTSLPPVMTQETTDSKSSPTEKSTARLPPVVMQTPKDSGTGTEKWIAVGITIGIIMMLIVIVAICVTYACVKRKTIRKERKKHRYVPSIRKHTDDVDSEYDHVYDVVEDVATSCSIEGSSNLKNMERLRLANLNLEREKLLGKEKSLQSVEETDNDDYLKPALPPARLPQNNHLQTTQNKDIDQPHFQERNFQDTAFELKEQKTTSQLNADRSSAPEGEYFILCPTESSDDCPSNNEGVTSNTAVRDDTNKSTDQMKTDETDGECIIPGTDPNKIVSTNISTQGETNVLNADTNSGIQNNITSRAYENENVLSNIVPVTRVSIYENDDEMNSTVPRGEIKSSEITKNCVPKSDISNNGDRNPSNNSLGDITGNSIPQERVCPYQNDYVLNNAVSQDEIKIPGKTNNYASENDKRFSVNSNQHIPSNIFLVDKTRNGFSETMAHPYENDDVSCNKALKTETKYHEGTENGTVQESDVNDNTMNAGVCSDMSSLGLLNNTHQNSLEESPITTRL